MDTAFRSMDDGTHLRERVDRAEKRIDAAESQWRAVLWQGWRRLGWALCVAAVLAMVGTPIGWLVVRGSAYGVAAQRNAEAQALRWSRSYWTAPSPVTVYCEDVRGEGHPGERYCAVRFPDRTRWELWCDDDPPATNDGCSNPLLTFRPTVANDAGVQ